MLNIGTPELFVILVVALLVVGPQRLPELARQIGRGLREFRKMQDDVKDMVRIDLDDTSTGSAAPAGSPIAPGVHRTRRPAHPNGDGPSTAGPAADAADDAPAPG
jgi:sec-independent protein translocase protein TatB